MKEEGLLPVLLLLLGLFLENGTCMRKLQEDAVAIDDDDDDDDDDDILLLRFFLFQ